MFKNHFMPEILLISVTGLAVAAALEDFRSRILPDKLNSFIAVLSIILLGITWGSWDGSNITLWFAIVAFHMVLVIVPPYGLGGGDLKLIAALGLSASYLALLVPWLVLSYFLAAIAGIWKKISQDNSTLPFGPWLVTAWIVIFVGQSACVEMVNCR